MRYADGVPQAAGLDRPIGTVAPRVGPKFEALGIRTIGDLLRHYPRRYADPSRLTDIAGLELDEKVSIVAEVRSCSGVLRSPSTGKLRVEAQVTDGTSVLHLAFFAQRKHMAEKFERDLRPGRRGLFTGKVGVFRGRAQLANPVSVWFDADDEGVALDDAGRPLPVYPASAALDSAKIAATVKAELARLRDGDVPDPLPPDVRERYGFGDVLDALRRVHQPETEQDWRQARERLRYEEAFVLQAELARRRLEVAGQHAVARERVVGGLLDAFDARLPFELTAGQRDVGEQLAAELARPAPMQRLLQGEVGSGKTVVALRAMLQVVDAGGQAALLAPTEVLAAQHARSLRLLLGDLAEAGLLGGAEQGTRIALLTGSVTGTARKQALLDAASGAAGIVVGTHALLEKTVQFAELGLVVVDEQHRFGVEQRDALRAKAAAQPHLLAMTATPIPRTVAMTVFGDLETSVLTELPAGRAGITTFVVPADRPAWTARTWARVREEVGKGGRAYVVCPRITGDDDDGADLVPVGPATLGDADTAPRRPPRAVLDVVDELRTLPELAGIEVGLLHGRLTSEEKDRALADFASGAVPVLVSTTVVEVGVDVPEATAMVILDADLFGVSQLHQLRGRVGRGGVPGLCLLVTEAEAGTIARERVDAVAGTLDGFQLAEVDLELRGEGDVLGSAQAGVRSSLRLLRVVKDSRLITRARELAETLLAEDPSLDAHPGLRDAIERRVSDDDRAALAKN